MPHATARLTLRAALFLVIAPLMWAGNAVVGRLAAGWIPPVTLNYFRWLIAFALLLPLGGWVLRRGSPMWADWKRFAALGALAISGYNMLQYLALQTSTPVNVTLVASSMPVWMLLVGRIGFGAPIHGRNLWGAACSLSGVLVVMTQGEWQRLQQLQLVPGDAWMLLAALVWAIYSWMLTERREAPEIRQDWAAFLLAQVSMGLVWASLFTATEWSWLVWTGTTAAGPLVHWSWALVGVMLFTALGPSLVAYRCWGAGVQQAGPTLASFFSNLTPLFAALLSTAFLGEPPQAFHALAFGLIVLGIVVSSSGRR